MLVLWGQHLVLWKKSGNFSGTWRWREDILLKPHKSSTRVQENCQGFSKHPKFWRSELYSSRYLGLSAVPSNFLKTCRPDPHLSQHLSQKSSKIRVGTENFQKVRRRCTQMKIARAVELRSSKFWMFWKAEMFLLKISTTFPGFRVIHPQFTRSSLFFVQMSEYGSQFRYSSHLSPIKLD